MQLYGYQRDFNEGINESFARGNQYVFGSSPTGSGKTVVFSHRLNSSKAPQAAIAHRSELVGQMSIALAKFGVRHRILAPPQVIKRINQAHLIKLKKSFYDPSAPVACVSIQSLAANVDRYRSWGRGICDWITDEGHHLLKENMWGKGVDLFTNARGLGVSAHCGRADGRGLGRGNKIITERDAFGSPLAWTWDGDGYYQDIVHGPTMRELINAGYLSEYIIYAPPSDFVREGLDVGDSGEFKTQQVKKRAKESRIYSDVVDAYLKYAPGKLDIVFAVDIEDAETIALNFRNRGVPAAAVSSKTHPDVRAQVLEDFENRKIMVLVNVDLFGEGYDLPALECVQFARPTASFQTYIQQFGRVLRVLPGKLFGIVIDHVGNVDEHGLPDAPHIQTLNRRPRGTRGARDPDAVPTRKCRNPQCTRVYEAIHPKCIYCGTEPLIIERTKPEYVDGDLIMLDRETINRLRGEADNNIQMPFLRNMQDSPKKRAIENACRARCEAQQMLRENMTWWAGWQQSRQLTMSQMHRAFYFRFGVDVLTAQTLDRADTLELNAKVADHINQMAGVVK